MIKQFFFQKLQIGKLHARSKIPELRSPEWLGLRAVFRPALGLVGTRASGEGAVGGVISGRVPASVATGRRTLQFLAAEKAVKSDRGIHRRVNF